MTVNAFLSPTSRSKFWDNSGNPLAFGKLYTYAAGTLIPAATYVDSTQTTPNTNPINLDFRGECSLWLPPNIAFKYLLTDSAGNVIPGWPVDQIVISQLITLYGGVDTGASNAYVLNYTANFTSLMDGIVIYWIPSSNSTGPITLNVNSLGPVAVIQQNGNPLGLGSIQANTVVQVMYKGGNWLLLSASTTIPQTGSFIYTTSGFSTVFSETATYTVLNGICTLNFPHTTDYFSPSVNNANFFYLNGLPPYLQPISIQQSATFPGVDGGAKIATVVAVLNPGSSQITLQPSDSSSSTSWTSSGTKAIGGFSLSGGPYGVNISYSLVT